MKDPLKKLKEVLQKVHTHDLHVQSNLAAVTQDRKYLELETDGQLALRELEIFLKGLDQEWHPIETAPERECIDLWVVNNVSGLETRYTDCTIIKGNWEFIDNNGNPQPVCPYPFIVPTHWRYSPNPPIESF